MGIFRESCQSKAIVNKKTSNYIANMCDNGSKNVSQIMLNSNNVNST